MADEEKEATLKKAADSFGHVMAKVAQGLRDKSS